MRAFGAGVTHISRGALHCYDPDTGWICLPNLDARYSLPQSFDVRINCNSRGMRDSEKIITKPAGIKRILVLGDSQMWGYGVENNEMLSSVLQKLIPGTETINLGVCGYSTVQELVRLEAEGLRYNPDWVILSFSWNDLEDNFDDKDGGRPIAEITADGGLRIINRPVAKQWKSPGKQWFRRYSRLFNLGEYWLGNIKWMNKDKRRAEALMLQALPSASRPKLKKANSFLEFSTLDIYSRPTPEIDIGWHAMELLISDIKKKISDKGVKLLVIYNPEIESVDKTSFEQFSNMISGDKGSLELDWDRPARRLGEICNSLGVYFLDPQPAFRQNENPRGLFLKRNNHWSAQGHYIAAQEAAKKIQSIENMNK